MSKKIINNRYKIMEKLGEGGMGEIFLAEDKLYEKQIALKTIRREIVQQKTIDRFKIEFEVMTRLKHPNLARVYDFGFDDEAQNYFITMEYIEGVTLKEWLETQRYQRVGNSLESERKTMDVFVALLRAIEFIHSRKILHRDIKPENIMIDQPESYPPNFLSSYYPIKVMDFGLADLGKTEKAQTKGTLLYLAPETLDGQADERSDIFALGMTFYNLITNNMFYANTGEKYTKEVLKSLQDRRSFSRDQHLAMEKFPFPPLKEIIKKMTAYEPAHRYNSCPEIIAHINATLNTSYPLETKSTREAYLLGASFVGRDQSLGQLMDWLEAEETGKKLFLVHGEAGIGKSRLFEEFRKYCQLRNVLFFQSDCLEWEQQNFGLFLPILRELLLHASPVLIKKYGGEIKKLLPAHERLHEVRANPTQAPKIEHWLLIQNITNFLLEYAENRPSAGSGNGKIVFYLNDMHWADEASVEALEELMYKINEELRMNNEKSKKESDHHSLRVYASSRPEGLVTLKNIKDKGRLIDVELRSFDEQNVQSYIDAVFGNGRIDGSVKDVIPEIHQKVGGNPFFLQELIKSLVELGIIRRKKVLWELTQSLDNANIPSNLKDLIRGGIERLNLTHDEMRIMQILSFLKYSVSYAELNQISPVSHELLQELERIEIVKTEELDGQIVYRTAHDLIREIIIEKIQDPDQLHEFVAQKLEKIHKENLEPYFIELAHHYSQTSNREKAIFYLEKAGRQAEKNYQNEVAIHFYDVLLELLGKENSEKRLEILLSKVDVLKVIGKWDEWEKLLHSCIEMADELNILEWKIKARIVFGVLKQRKGLYSEALDIYQALLKSFPLPKEQKGVLMNNSGNSYSRLGNAAKALECFQKALHIFREIGDRNVTCTILGNIGCIYLDKYDYDTAINYYEKQLALAKELDIKSELHNAYSNIGLLYYYQEDYDQAMYAYEKSFEVAKEMGMKDDIASITENIGLLWYELNHYEKALRFLKKSYRISQELGNMKRITMSVGNIGATYFKQGNYEKALEFFEKELDFALELDDKQSLSLAYGDIGNYYKQIGEYPKGDDYLSRAITIAEKYEMKYLLSDHYFLHAELLFLMETWEAAANLLSKARNVTAELQRESLLFKIDILSAKLAFKRADSDQKDMAIHQLEKMLAITDVDYERAVLNYELFFMTNSDECRLKSLELYKKLYQKNPNDEYQKRIEELFESNDESYPSGKLDNLEDSFL